MKKAEIKRRQQAKFQRVVQKIQYEKNLLKKSEFADAINIDRNILYALFHFRKPDFTELINAINKKWPEYNLPKSGTLSTSKSEHNPETMIVQETPLYTPVSGWREAYKLSEEIRKSQSKEMEALAAKYDALRDKYDKLCEGRKEDG